MLPDSYSIVAVIEPRAFKPPGKLSCRHPWLSKSRLIITRPRCRHEGLGVAPRASWNPRTVATGRRVEVVSSFIGADTDFSVHVTLTGRHRDFASSVMGCQTSPAYVLWVRKLRWLRVLSWPLPQANRCGSTARAPVLLRNIKWQNSYSVCAIKCWQYQWGGLVRICWG